MRSAAADHALTLLAAGAARGVEGRYDEALALLDQAADALSAPPTDPIALQIALARVDPLRLTGRLAEAAGIAREVSRLAEQSGETRLAGVAAVALGFCMTQSTEYEASLELALRGLALARAAGDGATEASAAHLRAFACVTQGRAAEAHAHYEQAAALTRIHGPPWELARVLASHAQLAMDLGDIEGGGARAAEAMQIAAAGPSPYVKVKANQVLAVWLLRVGRPDEALLHFERGMRLAQSIHDLQGQAIATNSIAEIHRARGDLDRASTLYAEAVALGDRAGSNTTLFRLNLALVSSHRGDWARVAETGERLADRATGAFHTLAVLVALAGHAALGHVEEASRWEARGRRNLDEQRLAEPDTAALLERAAELAGASADPSRLTLAARALGLSLRMVSALSDVASVVRIHAALVRLRAEGARVPFGPFDLIAPIGSGGMGEVWEAVHREEGQRVAVKVLTAMSARAEHTASALAAEIRAVARLNHRNIVAILDHGHVGPVAEAMTGGRLVLDSPYLVMELGAGSLAGRRGRIGWTELRAVLLDLLAALAHAHARGLVHLDLKPDNVLSGLPPDGGIKLTDFGLARAIGEAHQRIAGTPAYMAPEQARGDASTIGPWTDLYALGCLCWALLCGSPPYGSDHPHRVLERHVRGELPPLSPLVPVPEGLAAWLSRLLAPDPRDRFQAAADARLALLALGPATGGAVTPAPWSWSADPTVPLPGEHSAETFLFDLAAPLPAAPAPRPAPTRRVEKAPVPLDWRDPGLFMDGPTAALLGAGLSTLGLREVPLVGREAERDALWAALVCGQPRAVLLRGPAGVGKTRLASWLTSRALETGAGAPLVLSGPSPGAALAYNLQWTDHHGEALARAILARLGPLDEVDLAAVIDLVEAGRRGATPGLPETAAALALVLRRLAAQRAVILVVDDAHRELASLDLACRTLNALPGTHVLALILARDDLLAEAPVATQLLEPLLASPQTLSLSLAPLPDEDVRAVLRHLIRLDLALASEIARRAAGNPLFAVELVGDLVARGQLVPGEDGYQLRPGAEASLPDDVHMVWTRRLQTALQGLPGGTDAALEIGAVLGARFSDEEWRAVCARAGVAVPEALAARLLESRLAEREGEGWRLCHGMLRESLVRRAAEQGRLERWHLAAATELSRRLGTAPVRLGRHRMGAGRPAEAIEPLLSAVASRNPPPSPPEALALLDRVEEALRRAAIPVGDPRRVTAWLLRSASLQTLGRFEEALAFAGRAEEAARRAGNREQIASALRNAASALRARGRLTEAAAALDEVLALLDGSQDDEACARAWHTLALVQRSQGDPAKARALMARALVLAERAGDPRLVRTTLFALGAIELQLGLLPEARAHVEAGYASAEAAGDRADMAVCLNGLAELDRKVGKLDLAEARYRQANRLFQLAGLAVALYPRLNLALVLLARERWDEARQALSILLAEVSRQGREGLMGAIYTMLLPCDLGLGEGAAFDEHAAEARRLLERTGFAEPDTLAAAEQALAMAEALGEVARAEAVRALVEGQKARLRG